MAREKDLLTLERKCEHHATETAINNAREMQKQAAKSAKDAGKNKGILFGTTRAIGEIIGKAGFTP